MATKKIFTNTFITKLGFTFLVIILLMGATYILLTVHFSKMLFQETSQKLNSNLANHLIEEKFQTGSPFLEDGSINKPFFGDLMHDMMSVNRSIEVYLLNQQGNILYSVVLDHSNPNETKKQVDLKPIKQFLDSKGEEFILGDDPRNPESQKIFSAASFEKDGHKGYIYIVLAGQYYSEINQTLQTGYYNKMGLGGLGLTMVFVAILGWLSLIYLTKNLREIIAKVNRFQEGDLQSRISNPEKSDLSSLALTFNGMAETIQKNMEEIQSVDILRRELIANISHDLRTPLAIMQGYIETIQMKKDDLNNEEAQKYVSTIQNSIQQLTHLVSQLFEYSKLEAQQIKPEKEVFPITDLIHDMYAKYNILTKKKNIELTIGIQEQTPLVFADISMVERAIQNLLDNAIKFTPQNGNIKLSVKHDDQNVSIQVVDNGIGIPKDDQAIIFDRFQQTETGQKWRGSGLGLAIVKKIIDLHDGSIQVISRPNEGSIFEFYLPKYQAV